MDNDLEREFGPGSQPEHLPDGCWCRHPAGVHHYDPVRDYRELFCSVCKAIVRPEYIAELEAENERLRGALRRTLVEGEPNAHKRQRNKRPRPGCTWCEARNALAEEKE